MVALTQRQRNYVLPGYKGPIRLQDIIDSANGGGGGEGGAGPPGPPGADGDDGVSVTNAVVNGAGHLIITLSNGQTIDTGYVVGPKGEPGEDGGSGGGSDKPWFWMPPVASDFTLLSGDGTNLTLTDNPFVGLMINGGPIVGGSGDVSRIAVAPIPNPGGTWDIRVHALTFSDAQDYTKVLPLVLRDSVSGRMATMSLTNEFNPYANVNFASLTQYGGVTGEGFLNKGPAPTWFRIRCDGPNLTYYVAMDGMNWLDVATAPVTSYLSNRPNQFGFGVNMNKTTGKKTVITIDHMSMGE